MFIVPVILTGIYLVLDYLDFPWFESQSLIRVGIATIWITYTLVALGDTIAQSLGLWTVTMNSIY